jgi:methylenetetrahydrofolate reductase (NADPH)
MKYALRCGVGNSVRALGLRGTAIARLLTESTPERVIADLAAAGGQDELGIDGLHLFNFGGFARTADWARAQAAS